MKECLALLLPPAVALVGVRLLRLLFGGEWCFRFGFGFRFALGLGLGMLVFSQAILLFTLIGFNSAPCLAWLALIWGFAEMVMAVKPSIGQIKYFKFQLSHLWLLGLLPLVAFFWVFGRLAVVESTVEIDAVLHWVFKSKIFFYKQGPEFIGLIHNPNLAHAHLDYPTLVPALYTLGYGAQGGVYEFVNKVWPVWMLAGLCFAILSLAGTWCRPRLLPIALVNLICFLPATLCYIDWEGGTIPMLFYASVTGLLFVTALVRTDIFLFAVGIIFLAGCAMTKFEGVLYSGLWLCALAPACWRQRWFKNPCFWKAATVAAICVMPYIAFRLNKPLSHIECDWASTAVHSPGTAWRTFPELLGIGLGCRFFSITSFKWSVTDDGHLQWIGHWASPADLLNYHLSILPWLTLLLLGLALWRGPHRPAILRLTLVILGMFTLLAFVLACVPHNHSNEAAYILSKTGEDLGRYFYPYFMTWFVGIVSLWFCDVSPTPSPAKSTLKTRLKNPREGRHSAIPV